MDARYSGERKRFGCQRNEVGAGEKDTDMEDEYTYIEEAGIWQCNNCGAYATEKTDIKHYASCKPGESEYWKEYYNSVEDQRWQDENHRSNRNPQKRLC